MDSDPSQIPVLPIPFEHPLTRFAQSLTAGQAKIVAIGSSTTAGRGNITAYPGRLLSLLQNECQKANVAMVNKGIGGQEAPIEFQRFETDVIVEKPDLVIWQVGTNAVWQSPDRNPRPPSFDETTSAIRDGLVQLQARTVADVILMDLQYVPALLTPAKKSRAIAMVEAISELARDAGVNVFRRFAFMKGLHEVEQVSFDRMVDPNDDDRLHDSDWTTQRVAWAIKLAIVGGIAKARSSAAASLPPRSSDRMSLCKMEATHPRCACEGYPDGPGRASRKEGESWVIIARLLSVSIPRSYAMRSQLRTPAGVARFGF